MHRSCEAEWLCPPIRQGAERSHMHRSCEAGWRSPPIRQGAERSHMHRSCEAGWRSPPIRQGAERSHMHRSCEAGWRSPPIRQGAKDFRENFGNGGKKMNEEHGKILTEKRQRNYGVYIKPIIEELEKQFKYFTKVSDCCW